jgi:hypothetical protein
MNNNIFDNEYYVMDVEGADNHPMLAWGKNSARPFLVDEEIDMKELNNPLEIEFNTPYPKTPVMADNLHLMFKRVLSERIKLLFERLQIPKVQFIPVIIVTNKKQKIEGHYIFHCWNNICAVDKNNYEGGEIDEDGLITDLESFSLDAKVLEKISLEQRLVFCLSENTDFIIVHQSIKDAIENAGATGFRFYQISKWSPSAIFED